MNDKPLRKGDHGPRASLLLRLLTRRGYAAGNSGTFDPATRQAVRAFQAQNLDQHGLPLVIDGVVGPLTQWSLQHPKPLIDTPAAVDFAAMPAAGGSARGRAALAAAIGELKAGACESGGNNCGAFVRKYLAPAGVAEGNSWCASFVSWCYLQAAGGGKAAMPFAYVPGARAMLAEFKAQGGAHAPGDGYLPQPGDTVVWWRVNARGWQGHAGLVHSVRDGMLYTIEGRIDRLLGYGHVP